MIITIIIIIFITTFLVLNIVFSNIKNLTLIIISCKMVISIFTAFLVPLLFVFFISQYVMICYYFPSTLGWNVLLLLQYYY